MQVADTVHVQLNGSYLCMYPAYCDARRNLIRVWQVPGVMVSVMTNGSQVGHISLFSTSVAADAVSHLDCSVEGACVHGAT